LDGKFTKTEPQKDDDKYREFVGLIISNQAKINAFILCMIPQKQDSQDILQDTLTEMWRKYDQFEKGSNFLAWSFSIAKFKILNYRRKKKNNKLLFSDRLLKIFENESEGRFRAIESRIDRLKECVRALSSKETKLLRLRYEDDLTFREIANIYGYSHQAMCKAMANIHSRLVNCINMREALL